MNGVKRLRARLARRWRDRSWRAFAPGSLPWLMLWQARMVPRRRENAPIVRWLLALGMAGFQALMVFLLGLEKPGGARLLDGAELAWLILLPVLPALAILLPTQFYRWLTQGRELWPYLLSPLAFGRVFLSGVLITGLFFGGLVLLLPAMIANAMVWHGDGRGMAFYPAAAGLIGAGMLVALAPVPWLARLPMVWLKRLPMMVGGAVTVAYVGLVIGLDPDARERRHHAVQGARAASGAGNGPLHFGSPGQDFANDLFDPTSALWWALAVGVPVLLVALAWKMAPVAHGLVLRFAEEAGETGNADKASAERPGVPGEPAATADARRSDKAPSFDRFRRALVGLGLVRAPAPGVFSFRPRPLWWRVVLKEWRQLLRDPARMASLVGLPLSTLLGFFLVFRKSLADGSFQPDHLAVMMALVGGELGFMLGRLFLAADDAPALLATSPVPRARWLAWKAVAVMLPVAAFLAVPAAFLAIAWRAWWAALCGWLGGLGAGAMLVAYFAAGPQTATRKGALARSAPVASFSDRLGASALVVGWVLTTGFLASRWWVWGGLCLLVVGAGFGAWIGDTVRHGALFEESPEEEGTA